MLIRRERPSDIPRIREIHTAAFMRDPEHPEVPPEVGLLDELRVSDAWIPELSLVAEEDGSVVGHVTTTRGHVGELPVLGLGPIAVEPSAQNQGIGTALVHATIGASDAMGESLIGLVGSVEFYSRFGFVTSTELAIIPPDPAYGENFQVRTLTAIPEGVSGQFRYALPFDEIEDA